MRVGILFGHIYALGIVTLQTKLGQVQGTAIARYAKCCGRWSHEDKTAVTTIWQAKKNRAVALLFIRVPQASEVGFSFSSSDAIPPSSVGNKALSMPALCHAFYLSTLLSASLLLPSAVGHSSVAASPCSKEHLQNAVNTFLINTYIFLIWRTSTRKVRDRVGT